MAEEQILNNLSPETEPPPPLAAEATAPEIPAGAVDTAPDPAKLKAEIEKLQAKRKKAEEDARYWEEREGRDRARAFYEARQEKKQSVSTPAEAPSVGPEPKPSDFPDYDQYVLALADHRASKKIAEWELTQAKKRSEETQQQEMTALREKLNEGYAKYADFEAVAYDPAAAHITPMIVDILKGCEQPADTLYYLAKNRIEGVAISRMTPVRAAMEIAKIEAKLASSQGNNAPSPPPKNKPVTGAPPPINPLSGASGGIEKDPEKMTQKEYEQWRISKGARRF